MLHLKSFIFAASSATVHLHTDVSGSALLNSPAASVPVLLPNTTHIRTLEREHASSCSTWWWPYVSQSTCWSLHSHTSGGPTCVLTLKSCFIHRINQPPAPPPHLPLSDTAGKPLLITSIQNLNLKYITSFHPCWLITAFFFKRSLDGTWLP